MKMNKITSDVIEAWFDSLRTGAGKIKNTTINGYYATLLTMLKWTVKKKILLSDPTLEIKKLINDRKDIKIITQEEFTKLFGMDWETVWENDRIAYTANKLAALTGMRISEVLGFRGEYVFDDHIFVCAQYDRYGYRPTKTKDQSNIPLAPDMITDLKELKTINGQGFLFSENGGVKPIDHKRAINPFYKALNNIGITDTQIKERGLTLHGWRHFCNTEMLKGGLSIEQTQAVTRHKSERMTEWYNHFDPSDFVKALEVQEALLHPQKPVDKNNEKQENSVGLKILKMPKPMEAQEQKRA
jgi:integrase